MKPSKRIKRILKKVSEIELMLDFYTNGKNPLTKDFKEIKEVINDLAMDQKENNARIAKIFKKNSKNKDIS